MSTLYIWKNNKGVPKLCSMEKRGHEYNQFINCKVLCKFLLNALPGNTIDQFLTNITEGVPTVGETLAYSIRKNIEKNAKW